MLYRNTKTGSIIDVPSILKGDWTPIEESQPQEEPAQEKKKTARKRTTKKPEEA